MRWKIGSQSNQDRPALELRSLPLRPRRRDHAAGAAPADTNVVPVWRPLRSRRRGRVFEEVRAGERLTAYTTDRLGGLMDGAHLAGHCRETRGQQMQYSGEQLDQIYEDYH